MYEGKDSSNPFLSLTSDKFQKVHIPSEREVELTIENNGVLHLVETEDGSDILVLSFIYHS